jgi:phosphate transport system protein
MADWARSMLRDSLDAFVREDTELALQVCQRDDFIDNLTAQIFRDMLAYMAQDSQTVGRAIRILFLAKYLERIADHATNIAEMVIYMVKGKSIRHMSPPPSSI